MGARLTWPRPQVDDASKPTAMYKIPNEQEEVLKAGAIIEVDAVGTGVCCCMSVCACVYIIETAVPPSRWR